MRRTGTDLASVPGHLWAIRQAVLEVGPLDAATEPVPLGGRDPRAEVRSLVIYLSDLVDRAAARRRCSRGELIDLALGQPVLHGRRPPAVVGLWERRSS
jgi:hypothetical protein